MEISQSNIIPLLSQLQEGAYIVNTDKVITFWNKAAEAISGYRADEVVGSSCSDNILNHIDQHGNALCLSACPLSFTLNDEKIRKNDLFLHHKKGYRIPISVQTMPLYDEEKNVIGGLETFLQLISNQDTENRIRELSQMALICKLTQLGNRAALDQEMEKSLLQYHELNMNFGVMFFDIDYFKKFNDEYGHEVGDKILKTVAGNLLYNSRPFDFYARWGGEEFIAIIPNVNERHLIEMAERLRILIENSFIMHEDKQLSITVSVGCTLAREKDTRETIFNRVDKLLYQCKNEGRNQSLFG